MKQIRKLAALILVLSVLFSLAVPTLAASSVQTEMQGSAAYMVSAVKAPEVSSIGGEWAVLGAHAELHAARVGNIRHDDGLARFFQGLLHRLDLGRTAGLAGGRTQAAADDGYGFRIADHGQNLFQRLFLCNNHKM